MHAGLFATPGGVEIMATSSLKLIWGLRVESMETWNRLVHLTRFYQTTRTTWIQQEQKYFYSRKVAPDGVAKPACAGIFGLRVGVVGRFA